MHKKVTSPLIENYGYFNMTKRIVDQKQNWHDHLLWGQSCTM